MLSVNGLITMLLDLGRIGLAKCWCSQLDTASYNILVRGSDSNPTAIGIQLKTVGWVLSLKRAFKYLNIIIP